MIHAQVSSFNQYNASLSSLDPAYIANINKDQVSLISRNEWPGYKLGSVSSEFAINKFAERLNSSFGIVTHYAFGTQGSSSRFSQQVQYAYRLLFLDDKYLNFGIGMTHEQTAIDVNNFYYKFEPKRDYPASPENIIQSEKINLSAGFIYQSTDPQRYIGFSIRDRTLTDLAATGSRTLHSSPTYSLHSMTMLPFDRETQIIFSLFAEHTGKLSFDIQDTGRTVLHPAYNYFMGQINFYRHKAGIIGLGYKYFSQNYGAFTFRIACFPTFGIPLFIGYGFDTKPYIQYDKIHFYSSHEFYLKFNFSNSR